MPTYYTLKDQVPLLPGQTLGFTSGKGYYAAGTPTPTQATKNTTAAPPTVDKPVATPAQVQPTPANAAQVARQTTAAPPSIDQPVATPAQAQPVPANAAQATRNTTAYLNPVQPVAVEARTQPISANAAQVARSTIAHPADAPASGEHGVAYYTFRTQVPLEPGQTIGFTPGRGYHVIGAADRLPPGVELSATQPIEAHEAARRPFVGLNRVQPSASGTLVPHASEMENTPSRQLLGVQSTATGTPIRKSDASGAPPAPEDRRLASAAPGSKPAKPLTSVGLKKANTVVADAVGEAGKPYVTAGRSPSVGFDCSGLVQWAYGQVGINLPAPSQNQYALLEKYGAKVPLSKIEPGDIVFYRGETDQPSPAHVGIYAGHGEVIQALGHAWGIHQWSLDWAGTPVAVYRIIGQ